MIGLVAHVAWHIGGCAKSGNCTLFTSTGFVSAWSLPLHLSLFATWEIEACRRGPCQLQKLFVAWRFPARPSEGVFLGRRYTAGALRYLRPVRGASTAEYAIIVSDGGRQGWGKPLFNRKNHVCVCRLTTAVWGTEPTCCNQMLWHTWWQGLFPDRRILRAQRVLPNVGAAQRHHGRWYLDRGHESQQAMAAFAFGCYFKCDLPQLLTM